MCVVTYSKRANYGSKQKLIAFDGKPKWGYVEITAQCSHKCSWCYGGFNHQLTEIMALADFEKVADKLEQIGITQLSLAGGEPTDHPDFEAILAACQGRFMVNIVSHGDWRNPELAKVLKTYGVNQVQFNYQGQVLHNRVHGVKDSYRRMLESINTTKQQGIEVVCSLTVGAYNLERIPEIFKEIKALDANRIRVWEATGFGNKFRRDIEAKQIFDVAQTEAQKLGYDYVQSYEPLVEGDISVACPALSKLILWVNVKGQHIFCGAVPGQLNNPLSNLLDDNAELVLENQDRFVQAFTNQPKFCMARTEQGKDKGQ